jgi:hypothetical protein
VNAILGRASTNDSLVAGPAVKARVGVSLVLSMGLVAAAVAPAGSAAIDPAGPALLAPQGNGLIAFVSRRDGNAEIYTTMPDGVEQVNRTQAPGSDETQPAWSPDGLKLAFVTDRDGNLEIYVLDLEGGGAAARLTNDARPDLDPAWSPDGSRIVFTRQVKGRPQVFTMAADGTGARRLLAGATYDSEPAWSSDGTTIAFRRRTASGLDVFAMNADGTGIRNLTATPGKNEWSPAWSPAGESIAYVSDRDGNPEVYVMDADGTDRRNLSNDPGQDGDPAFAPDGGTRLAYTSLRQGEPELFIVNNPSGVPYGTVAVTHLGDAAADPAWQPLPASPPAGWPIEHVVVIYMENHSFDNVFGHLCATELSCDGATSGKLLDGSTIPLPPADDIPPNVPHSSTAQAIAMNGGLMNGFEGLHYCSADGGYACYQAFTPDQLPVLSDLARNFAISDRTFETAAVGSWGSHLELAATTLNGFYSAIPKPGSRGPGVYAGWGCDSNIDSPWSPTPLDQTAKYPTCIPFPDGTGPYRPSPVPWVPSIMGRLQQAGLRWRLYVPSFVDAGYGWAICPTFAECLHTTQRGHMVEDESFVDDAGGDQLPQFSILVPEGPDSQHNNYSMTVGEQWLAENLAALMNGPNWDSTAVFLTYDDCGCFYDHVTPPPGAGIRVPMVIMSPYAKQAFTDSNVASMASMLAFTEHLFGLAPLSRVDATAYDFRDAFDFSQSPRDGIALRPASVPEWELRWLASHPPDPDDPT